MTFVKEIGEHLKAGQSSKVRELTLQALAEGISSSEVLEELLGCMAELGIKFKNNEVYVPEVLIVARAFNAAIEILEPLMDPTEVYSIGTVVIGTVEGDLHDIGKNLVKMMLRGIGFKVIDLGVDVTAETFVEAIIEHKAQVLAISALLTTTMIKIKETVDLLVKKGIRQQVYILIGGAPVTSNYAREIGADAYATDAGSAADLFLNVTKV
ncbi:MAG: corrinoid protein [Vallitaleaceae bacterium]|nr:corrinoid protein [Vallitaleaceae bacterium]